MAVAVVVSTINQQADVDTTASQIDLLAAGTGINGAVLTISWLESVIGAGMTLDSVVHQVAGAFVRIGEVLNSGVHTEVWFIGSAAQLAQDIPIDVTYGGDITVGRANSYTTVFGLTGTGADNSAFGVPSTASGNTDAPTVAVVKDSDGGLVVASLGLLVGIPDPTITVGGGETEAAQGFVGGAGVRCANQSSYESVADVAGASVTMNATFTVVGVPVNEKWGMVAVEILDSTLKDPILCGGVVPYPR